MRNPALKGRLAVMFARNAGTRQETGSRTGGKRAAVKGACKPL